MADNCEPLFAIREEFVDKIEDANTAISGAADNLAAAMIALAGAEAGAGVCLFMGPTPAAAVCGVTAGIAIAAALAAVAYYESVLEEAQAALQSAQNGLDQVDALLSHCDALEDWQTEAAHALLEEAPSADEVDVPEVDDSELSEAESAVAELEGLDLEGAYG